MFGRTSPVRTAPSGRELILDHEFGAQPRHLGNGLTATSSPVGMVLESPNQPDYFVPPLACDGLPGRFAIEGRKRLVQPPAHPAGHEAPEQVLLLRWAQAAGSLIGDIRS